MDLSNDIDPKKKQELEDLVELLENIRGRHTELVTVLIPAGHNAYNVVRQLEAEKSTAANIKSKQTRTSVIEALEKIIRELKNLKATPKNGLALYAGNVSDKEGVSDIQLWQYEPPKPLNVRIYRCDQTFVLDPLKAMLEIDEVYALLVMDRKEATFGLLEGKQIKVLRHMTSGVPGKVRAGGQSSQRFHRITEGLAKEFFRRVAETMKELFFDMKKLKGVLVGGPIPTKEEFLETGQLVTKLKEKVISVRDLGDTGEHGLEELVELAEEDIAKQELIKEKKILERFFDTLGKHRDKALYGEEKVALALQRGAVSVLLMSKKYLKEFPDKAKAVEKAAEGIGSELHVISNDNQDADQFYNLTQGLGAILRFAIE
tara:strand:- start:223 stop:1344 length:1122 start_codon:yes stop_codon:yes gene_type:complete